MSGGDDQERLQRLKTRKRALIEEERELETQINEIEKRIRLEKEAKTPNVSCFATSTSNINVFFRCHFQLCKQRKRFKICWMFTQTMTLFFWTPRVNSLCKVKLMQLFVTSKIVSALFTIT